MGLHKWATTSILCPEGLLPRPPFSFMLLGFGRVGCVSSVFVRFGEPHTLEALTAIWLILPVVIRLSQRLSHACLSISNCTVKLRMAHYISYSLFDSTLLLG